MRTVILVAFVLVVAGAGVALGHSPGDLLATFDFRVESFALDPTGMRLYASLPQEASVAVIDSENLTLEAVVPVGPNPTGLAVSPDGTRLYVCTSGMYALTVVDTASLSVVDSIPLPRPPSDVEVGNGGRLYITPGLGGVGYGGIMQVDSETGAFQEEFSLGVFVYRRSLLEISPDRNVLYMANRGLSPGTLAKFDVSTEVPVLLYKNPHGSLGSNGQDLALSHSGDRVYYAVGSGNLGYTIATIRTVDMQVIGYFNIGAYPREITLSPDDAIAYAVHSQGHIDLFDTVTYEGIDAYPMFGEASELIVDPSGRYLFAAVGEELRVYSAGGPQNAPPMADAGSDASVECESADGSLVMLDGSASTDPDSTPGTNDDILFFDWFEDFGQATETFLGQGEILGVTLPLGSHDITLRVTDRVGATDTDDVVKTVVDTTPPEISVDIDPETLWPPNHRLVDVAASVSASDLCGTPDITLASVTSSEPDNASHGGDGNTVNDIQGADVGTADFGFNLRAERDGTGGGRVYTVTYAATDSFGNQASAESLVDVPHDRGGETDPVELRAEKNGNGTVLRWTAVEGALHYNAVRGRLDNVTESALSIDLGTVHCVETKSLDETTEGSEDPEIPKQGEAFFYLVEHDEGSRTSYGTESASKPRSPGAGDCP